MIGRHEANKRAKCSTIRLVEERSAFSAALLLLKIIFEVGIGSPVTIAAGDFLSAG